MSEVCDCAFYGHFEQFLLQSSAIFKTQHNAAKFLQTEPSHKFHHKTYWNDRNGKSVFAMRRLKVNEVDVFQATVEPKSRGNSPR